MRHTLEVYHDFFPLSRDFVFFLKEGTKARDALTCAVYAAGRPGRHGLSGVGSGNMRAESCRCNVLRYAYAAGQNSLGYTERKAGE